MSFEEDYVKVEDKKGGGWLVIRLTPSGHDIIARSHSKYYAQDIVLAMKKYFLEENPRDGING